MKKSDSAGSISANTGLEKPIAVTPSEEASELLAGKFSEQTAELAAAELAAAELAAAELAAAAKLAEAAEAEKQPSTEQKDKKASSSKFSFRTVISWYIVGLFLNSFLKNYQAFQLLHSAFNSITILQRLFSFVITPIFLSLLLYPLLAVINSKIKSFDANKIINKLSPFLVIGTAFNLGATMLNSLSLGVIAVSIIAALPSIKTTTPTIVAAASTAPVLTVWQSAKNRVKKFFSSIKNIILNNLTGLLSLAALFFLMPTQVISSMPITATSYLLMGHLALLTSPLLALVLPILPSKIKGYNLHHIVAGIYLGIGIALLINKILISGLAAIGTPFVLAIVAPASIIFASKNMHRNSIINNLLILAATAASMAITASLSNAKNFFPFVRNLAWSLLAIKSIIASSEFLAKKSISAISSIASKHTNGTLKTDILDLVKKIKPYFLTLIALTALACGIHFLAYSLTPFLTMIGAACQYIGQSIKQSAISLFNTLTNNEMHFNADEAFKYAQINAENNFASLQKTSISFLQAEYSASVAQGSNALTYAAKNLLPDYNSINETSMQNHPVPVTTMTNSHTAGR